MKESRRPTGLNEVETEDPNTLGYSVFIPIPLSATQAVQKIEDFKLLNLAFEITPTYAKLINGSPKLIQYYLNGGRSSYNRK